MTVRTKPTRFTTPGRQGTACVWHAPRAGRVNLNILALAALVAFILIGVAMVLRGPLTNITASYRATAEQRVIRHRQDQQRQALEQTIARDLSAVTAALQRLTASASAIERQVQTAIGAPLQSAITHPPTSVRRAFLASDSFRDAWTDLVNAVPSPATLDHWTAVSTAIATRLSQHNVRDSDCQELAQMLASIQSQQARIDGLDLSFLYADQALDSQHSVETIQATERR